MAFIIPLRIEDLLNISEPGQYRVEEVLTVREIKDKWTECHESFGQQGPAFILDYFDIFYSILTHRNVLDDTIKYGAFSTLKKGLIALLNDFNIMFDDEEGMIDDDVRDLNVTILKMLVYMSCQMLQQYEMDATTQAKRIFVPTGKGQSRAKQKQKSSVCDWELEKLDAIRVLKDLYSLPLKQLWRPPVIEEEFLNVMSNCCYRCLENTNINRSKELKDAIFQLLANLMKKQSQHIGNGVKIVQMLQLYEHLAVPLAQAVTLFVQDYGLKNVVNEIIMEIGSAENKNLSADGTGTKSFSVFLGELSHQIPDAILANIMILVTYLNSEPYGMRNCVLSIMGEILLHTLGRENLDDKSRDLRDRFLDLLEDHIHDVNAFVRSRVLQIWATLFQEKTVPIVRQKRLLKLVIGRLMDKASSVRKNSIQLLKCILQSNPFAAKVKLLTCIA